MIGQLLDRVQVHEKTVREFACIVVIDEELNGLDITSEVSNVHVSYLTNISSQSIL